MKGVVWSQYLVDMYTVVAFKMQRHDFYFYPQVSKPYGHGFVMFSSTAGPMLSGKLKCMFILGGALRSVVHRFFSLMRIVMDLY